MNLINIAIDGPVGCGKSDTAKLLAKKLSYKFLDTGAMYRAVAYYCKRQNIDPQNITKEHLEEIELEFNNKNHITVNGEEIEKYIRNQQIGALASTIAKNVHVRKLLVEKQQKIVKNKGYIAEGRDIGSVVMPDAELKIFLTASVETRAKRRQKQYKEKGINITFEQLKKEVEERDYQDINRKISPLIKTKDAKEVDTTQMTLKEQVEVCLKLAKGVIKDKRIEY